MGASGLHISRWFRVFSRECRMCRGALALALFLLIALVPCTLAAAEPDPLPLPPRDALETIRVHDGFSVELVAAEPLVMDPVAIAWGIDGRLWVAEMADYPLGLEGDGKPGGRVRFLEDSDGDGTYDRSTVFLDGLNFPNGVLPWRDGVLVTAAPEILYAADTDGDGRADTREALFTGFQEGNQQLRVNGLQRGLDNWVHCASGSHRANYGADSQVHSLKTGESISLGSRDFRFRPDTGALDPQSGPTQFGRNRDEWGNWFGCMNSYPLWHYVLEDSYLRRNPHFTPPDTWRQLILPRNPRVYPAKAPQKRFHSFEQTGRFTSACGGMIYRDELLYPRDGRMHGFTCEPFHNLVQHNVIVPDGISFRGYRDEHEGSIDFFASTDRWCRPVMVRTGPDGALWVVDMYRFIIEHPQFLTDEGRMELEALYRAGSDRGRIYRIFPKDQAPRAIPRIDRMTPEECIAMLEHPNGVVRDLAQQRLVWDGKLAATGELEKLVRKSANPLARVHALWTLEGLGALSPALVADALNDAHPGVRRHALRLSELFAGDVDAHPQLRSAIAAMTGEPDAHVRLQLACTLGQWPGDEPANALAAIAIRDAGDPQFAAAVLSSANAANIEALVTALLAPRAAGAGAGDLAGRLLALSVPLGNARATLNGLEEVFRMADPDEETRAWQCGVVAGLLDSLKKHGASLEEIVAGAAAPGETSASTVTRLIDRLRADARAIALDSTAADHRRAAALRLMARADDPGERAAEIVLLGGLLAPGVSPDLQSAAIAHLATMDDPSVADALLSGWKSHGPAVQSEVLGVIPTRQAWVTRLITEMESGRIPPGQISPLIQQNLRQQAGKDGRERLAKLFDAATSGTRREVLEANHAALDLKGDPARGAALFGTVCAACHRLDGVGREVGPGLASLSDRRPIALLTAILDPNAQLDARYITYIATTRDGRTLTGFLASETANSITLASADDQRHDILRSDLARLESTGLSLMPDGLEAALDHQALADLIAYVAAAGLPPEREGAAP